MARTDNHYWPFKEPVSPWRHKYYAYFGRYSGVQYEANRKHRQNRRDRSYLHDWDNYTGPRRTERHYSLYHSM